MNRPPWRAPIKAALSLAWAAGLGASVLAVVLPTEPALSVPAPGDRQLRVLANTLLELIWINTKAPDPARVDSWDFVGVDRQLHVPEIWEIRVQAGGSEIPVAAMGFKRRVIYAPLKVRDLRIGNHLYLSLARPLAEGQVVVVENPRGNLWPAAVNFTAIMDSRRRSPLVHVSQVGYSPAEAKTAMIGGYLGSLGEMRLEAGGDFRLLEERSRREVFRGTLRRRPDRGFTYPAYQEVREADFSAFRVPGEYRLWVPSLGVSFPFIIHDGVAAALARAYALGLYHQRCGLANQLPFTRHVHGACHTAPAEIPRAEFHATDRFLAEASADYTNNARHIARPLKNLGASLYPFVNRGPIDVSGGHHDAGDYSKYTINSASFIHYLIFAADVFPGAGELDNLGLPESGDGRSDLLQEAKWEADFLVKMQDGDGGFYFLVYPRDRKYEQDVLPDQGDRQVVWPKNTAATAAAVAALAQCGSSPLFRRQFPLAARRYLQSAQKGWDFLERALARYGRDGAYQKLTHYGDDFMHDDELAWAACELFLATGDEAYHRRLAEWFNPADPATRKWGWWRLYEGFGCAIRSYAFAAKSGRLRPGQLDLVFLSRCESELMASAEEQWRRAEDCAYGTSFPEETKRVRSAGWYFPADQAFDLAVACQMAYPPLNDPRPRYLRALLSNLNYEAGCNPVNVCFLTGLGWKRPREIVHQYAQNDRRILPPSGLPIGSLQAGFGWMDNYKRELGELNFPADGDTTAPYPLYDRWGDSFNLQTEFVIVNQARGLACTAWLMARTPLKNQAWKAAPAHIIGLPEQAVVQRRLTAALQVSGLDVREARIVWEAQDQEPAFGETFNLTPAKPGPRWLEAEAQWPDGRRAFAVAQISVTAAR